MSKQTICLDFDGVCHSYTSGWKGASIILDPPVKGTFDFIIDASKIFKVSIYSSRSNQPGGIGAMNNWFRKWYVLQKTLSSVSVDDFMNMISFPENKPPAIIYIDDRAYMFTGTWPDLKDIKDFKPWNKK